MDERWMEERWLDEWIDGRKMEGGVCGSWLDRMDEQEMVGWLGGRVGGQMDGLMCRGTKEKVDRRVDGQWVGGRWMNEWVNK